MPKRKTTRQAARAVTLAQRSTTEPRLLAPPPVVDRWPIVIGQALSLTYIASVYRLATVGYRQQLVDCLRELLENDPDLYCVIQQRLLPVAGARIDIIPAKDKKEEALAAEIAEEVERQVRNIPSLTQHVCTMLWAWFFGVSAAEIEWERNREEGVRWKATGLSFIHSRRLSYPCPGTWDLYIWDQGQVGPLNWLSPTSDPPYGLRVADYPNKFVCHAPQVVADYPTREGVGRIIGVYCALKRMVVRVSAQDFERFVKPWVVGYFKTGINDEIRNAEDKDIATLEQAVKTLGAGNLSSSVLPDCLKVEILRAATNLNQADFLEFLNASLSKAILSQTFTTSAGKYGSRATADIGKEISESVFRYDARCMGDTLKRDLFTAIVKLNWPGKEHLTPDCNIDMEEEMEPADLSELASNLATFGVDVDGRQVAERTGVPLVKDGDAMAIPMKPPVPKMADGGKPPGKGKPAKGAKKKPNSSEEPAAA